MNDQELFYCMTPHDIQMLHSMIFVVNPFAMNTESTHRNIADVSEDQ